MALEFHMMGKGESTMKMHTLKERTHVTRDGKKLMGPKDTEGVLLGGAGHQIPLEHAVALGLVDDEAPAEKAEKKDKQPAEKKEKAPAEKKDKQPAESK
jgi:hypothetical protein